MRAVEMVLNCIVLRVATIAFSHYGVFSPVGLFTVSLVFSIEKVLGRAPNGQYTYDHN